jgi:hypothetical protein
MGLKTNNSPPDAQLSKMEVAIKNIMSLVAAGHLTVNQLMEHKATLAITAKAVSMEEPKWAMAMAKNMHQFRWYES